MRSRLVSRVSCRNKVDFSNPVLEKQLQSISDRYKEVGTLLSTESRPHVLSKLGKEYQGLASRVELIQEREECLSNLKGVEAMLEESEETGEVELQAMAEEEKAEIKGKLEELELDLIRVLTPRDSADDRGVVVEVRSGTGGDEASLFASEMFKMYQKYSANMGWQWEELAISKSDLGGFNNAQALVTGNAVFQHLKFESGVHRVQRVPANDKRIHTSAANVIVLPEAEEMDVEMRQSDLQIETMRSQGAGGQSVNKTESAVRITHLPTGLSVSMQDERCQHQNREKAMKILRSKIYDMERTKAMEARSELVMGAGATGSRGDKVRTYNFPQDRITDHRVGFTITGVERVLNGETLGSIVDELQEKDKLERLQVFLDKLTSSAPKLNE